MCIAVSHRWRRSSRGGDSPATMSMRNTSAHLRTRKQNNDFTSTSKGRRWWCGVATFDYGKVGHIRCSTRCVMMTSNDDRSHGSDSIYRRPLDSVLETQSTTDPLWCVVLDHWANWFFHVFMDVDKRLPNSDATRHTGVKIVDYRYYHFGSEA